MSRREEQLAKLKPVANEAKYIDFDEDTGNWCVFGDQSGFAYSSWSSKDQAERALKNW